MLSILIQTNNFLPFLFLLNLKRNRTIIPIVPSATPDTSINQLCKTKMKYIIRNTNASNLRYIIKLISWADRFGAIAAMQYAMLTAK